MNSQKTGLGCSTPLIMVTYNKPYSTAADNIAFTRCNGLTDLKGLAMIFPGQENPFIIFRSKEIYIYSKTNNKISINLLK